jgi:hypothetical protein
MSIAGAGSFFGRYLDASIETPGVVSTISDVSPLAPAALGKSAMGDAKVNKIAKTDSALNFT